MRSLLQMFAKPRTAAAAAPAPVPAEATGQTSLTAKSTAEGGPKQGIVMIEGALWAEPARTARLKLFLRDAATPAFEKEVAVGPEGGGFWLGVHGHLLPNGTHKARVALTDEAGTVLAERTLSIKVRNEGETARLVAQSLRARGAPLVLDGRCDSTSYDYANPSLAAWFDRAPEEAEAHIAKLEKAGKATAAEAQALRQFVKDGYLVVEDAIAPDHLKRLNGVLDEVVEKKIEGYEWGVSQRIHNLHLHYPAVKELWLHPKVMHLLSLIFDDKPRPCQTLTYVFGSEQQYHQDTIHLTPFPAGRMCGVWTALEDVQPDSGELVVYPGSHREPRVYMQHAGAAKVLDEDWTEFGDKVVPIWTEMLEKGGYRREVYRPKAGTVLIWHENLMHAGSPRRDRDKSRRSIVGHYFSNGAIVYYDSSGMPGILHED